jgi:hypothetical protein
MEHKDAVGRVEKGVLVTYVRVWVLSTVNRIEWGKLSE